MVRQLALMLITTTVSASDFARPGVVASTELREYAGLAGPRKRIVDEALALAAKDPWLKYQFGSAEPDQGGLDCSGAVYFILRKAGLNPRRTSAAQYQWVKEQSALTEVPAGTATLDHAAFSELQPGDLLFWSGTYVPTDGREVPVSHVQIYLGREKATGDPVMIGASDGRTYRGTKREGYGVFDFKLPRAGSKAKFLGYGLPLTAD